MEYKIVIPSYRRQDTLSQKTLPYLIKNGVDKSKIFVVVADDGEKDRYFETLPKHYSEIIVGVLGVGAVRNFIQKHFPEDQKIVSVDDDIVSLKRKIDDKRVIDVLDVEEHIEKAFCVCKRYGCGLWGVYPLVNPLFMKHKISLDLKYIIAAFYGFTNTHAEETFVELDDKEDYERSIKWYMRDGKVVRLNYIGIQTNYYKEPGGMQVERTEKRVRESGEYLLKTYPQYCSHFKARKKHFEIRLHDKLKVEGL